jgi:hypothetical protein
MKKILLTCLICAISAFAWIPGVCDIGDARQDSFGKAQDYILMKECIEGDGAPISLNDYQDKLYWCACYTGAMACYFGKNIEKIKNASLEELEKADEKATKLADKCFYKMKN